jgi:hypothetical protein
LLKVQQVLGKQEEFMAITMEVKRIPEDIEKSPLVPVVDS